jgi:hypothetical protein
MAASTCGQAYLRPAAGIASRTEEVCVAEEMTLERSSEWFMMYIMVAESAAALTLQVCCGSGSWGWNLVMRRWCPGPCCWISVSLTCRSEKGR